MTCIFINNYFIVYNLGNLETFVCDCGEKCRYRDLIEHGKASLRELVAVYAKNQSLAVKNLLKDRLSKMEIPQPPTTRNPFFGEIETPSTPSYEYDQPQQQHDNTPLESSSMQFQSSLHPINSDASMEITFSSSIGQQFNRAKLQTSQPCQGGSEQSGNNLKRPRYVSSSSSFVSIQAPFSPHVPALSSIIVDDFSKCPKCRVSHDLQNFPVVRCKICLGGYHFECAGKNFRGSPQFFCSSCCDFIDDENIDDMEMDEDIDENYREYSGFIELEISKAKKHIEKLSDSKKRVYAKLSPFYRYAVFLNRDYDEEDVFENQPDIIENANDVGDEENVVGGDGQENAVGGDGEENAVGDDGDEEQRDIDENQLLMRALGPQWRQIGEYKHFFIVKIFCPRIILLVKPKKLLQSMLNEISSYFLGFLKRAFFLKKF